MHCSRLRSRPRWIPAWGALPIPPLAAARSRLSPCPDSRPRRVAHRLGITPAPCTCQVRFAIRDGAITIVRVQHRRPGDQQDCHAERRECALRECRGRITEYGFRARPWPPSSGRLVPVSTDTVTGHHLGEILVTQPEAIITRIGGGSRQCPADEGAIRRIIVCADPASRPAGHAWLSPRMGLAQSRSLMVSTVPDSAAADVRGKQNVMPGSPYHPHWFGSAPSHARAGLSVDRAEACQRHRRKSLAAVAAELRAARHFRALPGHTAHLTGHPAFGRGMR
jgi:hypothetical protein